ncbi:ATP-binding cassette domain-containing protein [Elstera litoralis]|uniref:ATP-binding cassette domain-containing protein n=1 Tax=Elstera litoralis TaxID=552518 RepID=UPI001E4383F5|nr:ATP-binding cassette domain-containing protein [Elstera litoralis]
MLTVEALRLGYGGQPVLDGVSFTLAEGEALALLGRNGAGKSTLMKALIGLLPLEAGQIHWRGEDISRWPPFRRARAGIGYVPEDRRIFRRSHRRRKSRHRPAPARSGLAATALGL